MYFEKKFTMFEERIYEYRVAQYIPENKKK